MSRPGGRRYVWGHCHYSRSIQVLLLVAAGLGGASTHAEQQPPRSIYVEGYTSQSSYAPGEEVELHLASSVPRVSVVIHRLGREAEKVWENGDVPASDPPIPDRASSHGCDWPVTYRLKVPDHWQSGYYQATLSAEDQGGQYVHRGRRTAESSLFFIVRAADPGAGAKILLQLSTNTYNAYTNWGGHSLYAYHDRDDVQGHRVSFHRPQNSQFRNWELPFVAWAEGVGYEIDYAANIDLELRPELLERYRLILSVGHDEYWSKPMRDHLERFITQGGNVAFFSGNTCCWQVRTEDDGAALTCWKQWYNWDPLYRSGDPQLLSTLWSHHLVGRPENELTGVGFLWGGYHRSHGQLMDGPGSYIVHRPEHWVFAGTELDRDDRFGGANTIVGYECDGCQLRWEEGLPYPTGEDGTPESFTVLGTCPAQWAAGDSHWYERFPKDRVGAAVMGVYTRGGTVFTCGSTDWAHGLAGNDPVVEQITRNLLDRLGKEASQR